MPQPSYETTMTHRRSLMRSPKWEDPAPFPDGCVGGHLPTRNPDCIHNQPASAATEDAPEADVEVVVTTEAPVDPQEVAQVVAAAIQGVQPAPQPALVPVTVPDPPRTIGQDFKGATMTVADLLELAVQVRAAGFATNGSIRAWTDESGRVTRVLATERD